MSTTFLWASNRFLKEKQNNTGKLPIAKKNKKNKSGRRNRSTYNGMRPPAA
jgi:hypothetical protein